MGDTWGLFFVMVFMVGAMLLMTRGPRRDKGNWHDLISAQGRPDGNLPTVILFLAAFSALLGASATLGAGALLGACSAFIVGTAAGRALMGLVGVVAALAVGASFIASPAPAGFDWGATVAGRVLLLSGLLACFVVGAMSGVAFGGRSFRTFSLGKGRGLAFFGLIEFFVFIASPGGLEFFGLTQDEQVPLLVGGAVVAVVFGALAGQFTLFLAAVGVLVAAAGLSMLGLAVDPRAAPSLEMMAVGVVLYALLRWAGRKILG